jgi:hypothetical protein
MVSSGTDEEIVFTPVIAKIVALCGLPVYLTMVKFIEQQEWSESGHVTSIGVNEVKDFHTVRNNGNYDAKPMMIHLRMFKAFLMFYMRKCHELYTNLDEHDVMDFMHTQFKEYVGHRDNFVGHRGCWRLVWVRIAVVSYARYWHLEWTTGVRTNELMMMMMMMMMMISMKQSTCRCVSSFYSSWLNKCNQDC